MRIYLNNELKETGKTEFVIATPKSREKLLCKVETSGTFFSAGLSRTSAPKSYHIYTGCRVDRSNTIVSNITGIIDYLVTSGNEAWDDFFSSSFSIGRIVSLPICLDMEAKAGIFLYAHLGGDTDFDINQMGAIIFAQTIGAWKNGLEYPIFGNDICRLLNVDGAFPELDDDSYDELTEEVNTSDINLPAYITDEEAKSLQEEYDQSLLFDDTERSTDIRSILDGNEQRCTLKTTDQSIIGYKLQNREWTEEWASKTLGEWGIKFSTGNSLPYIIDVRDLQIEKSLQFGMGGVLIIGLYDQIRLIVNRYGIGWYEAWRTLALNLEHGATKYHYMLTGAEFSALCIASKRKFLDFTQEDTLIFEFEDFISNIKEILLMINQSNKQQSLDSLTTELLFGDVRRLKKTSNRSSDNRKIILLVGDQPKTEEVMTATLRFIQLEIKEFRNGAMRADLFACITRTVNLYTGNHEESWDKTLFWDKNKFMSILPELTDSLRQFEQKISQSQTGAGT